MSSTQTVTATEVAERFVASLAAKDFVAVEQLFDPAIRFRGLVPTTLREHAGAVDAVERLRLWFGDVGELELLESEVAELGGRVRLRYRFRGDEPGDGWSVVEQEGYADVLEGRISDLSLVCSGWRSTEPPR